MAKCGIDICAGDLRNQITIEAEDLGDDGSGGQKVVWVEHSKPWARIKPLSGRERIVSERLKSIVTHQITIRYDQVVYDDHAKMRIVWNGDIYNIRWRAEPENGRKRWLHILADENADN